MSYLPQILDLLKQPDYVPVPVDRLAEQLKVTKDEFPEFKREVAQHMRQGTLVKLKKNRVCLPRDADLVTGVIRFRQSGSAMLRVETAPEAPEAKPLQIRAEDTGVAMHGDRVVCRINQDKRPGRRSKRRGPVPLYSDEEPQTARVIRILERKYETLTGTLQKSRKFHFVIPSDPRIIQDILVEPSESKVKPRPKVNDKVVVRLHEWKQRHLNPEGEIIEVLGKTHTPGAEYKALLHQYDLNPEFPPQVMKEVEEIPAQVQSAQLQGRRDFRDTFTMTIDPQDAKDFDDALSVENLPNGNVRIGIHIADVSTYVRPGTQLDREAYERGNSTYLVGKVIPMLPHALSNGICSLVEAEDRLTKSVIIDFAPDGKRIKTAFANSVICSNKRLSYEQAHAILFTDDLEKIRQLPSPKAHQTGFAGKPLAQMSNEDITRIQESLRTLWKFASQIRKRRMAQGSLELDTPESKIYVDEEGYADQIVKVEYDESHQLIEEYMLLANEAVAKNLLNRNIALLHRVHDEPDPERLDELADTMDGFDIQCGDLTKRKNLTQLLKQIRKHPQAHMLRIEVLRSLKQACYRATPDGHFGLAKKHYTHFTSPIRRYCDLVVHRIFDQYLGGKKARDADNPRYTGSKLAVIAQHISLTEQNSTEAERESVKIKLLEFFERELAKPKPSVFDAVIMDIRNHGMFVELSESMAYGLIHISTLQDDLYKVSADNTELVGRRKKRRFQLGGHVPVSVARVDRFKRQIDFKVAGD